MLLKRLEPGDVGWWVTRLDRLGAQLRACSSHGRARLTPRPPPRNDPHPAKLAAPVLIPGAEYRVISLSAEVPPAARASSRPETQARPQCPLVAGADISPKKAASPLTDSCQSPVNFAVMHYGQHPCATLW